MITRAFEALRDIFGGRRRRRERDASLVVSTAIWAELISELGRRGEGWRESGAFLLGPAGSPTPVVTRVIYLDDLDPNCLTGGISFDGRHYHKLWDICAGEDLRVRADIHTHPGRSVQQSSIDQANPMVARRGHIALIVPELADRLVEPAQIGFHEYHGNDGWTSAYTTDAADRLVITK